MTTKVQWVPPTKAEHHLARALDALRTERRRIEADFGMSIGRYMSSLTPSEHGTVAVYLMADDRNTLEHIRWIHQQEIAYRKAWSVHFYRRRPDLGSADD